MSPASYQLLHPAMWVQIYIFCSFALNKKRLKMAHKAGFVNIIGNPNVGKSTLINELLGERLSIITAKAQTTRHRILGIYNDDDHQVVFSDTPGIVDPGYKLHDSMLKSVKGTFSDADIILYVVEVGETKVKDEDLLHKLTKVKVPVIVLINKIDLADTKVVEAQIEHWKNMVPNGMILPISALNKFNVDKVMEKVLELIPESPPYYDKDEYTDRPMRFFVAEIVREKILLNYSKEVPYSCEVVVEEYKDEPEIVHIRANIIVSRDSQKGIIIGHQGKMLKRTGIMARKDIEEMVGKQVMLNLYVKVDKNWRDDERKLKKYGY